MTDVGVDSALRNVEFFLYRLSAFAGRCLGRVRDSVPHDRIGDQLNAVLEPIPLGYKHPAIYSGR